MLRALPVTTVVIAVMIATGCAARTTFSSHQDHRLEPSRYRTFGWGPADALPTGDPRLDGNPFFNDHVQGAVERGLAAKGFELLSAGPPELLIHYHAAVSTRIDVDRLDQEYGYCISGDCEPAVVRFEAGTLVLDIIDARSKTLIWRGWAQNRLQDMIDDPDRMARTIDEAVRQMLSRFPPRLADVSVR